MQNLRQLVFFIHAISDKKKIGFSIISSIIAILIPINARGGSAKSAAKRNAEPPITIDSAQKRPGSVKLSGLWRL